MMSRMAKTPTPQTGFLAEPSYHRFDTTNITAYLEEALRLARALDKQVADGKALEIDDRKVLPMMVADRITNLCNMASSHSADQRSQSTGWSAV